MCWAKSESPGEVNNLVSLDNAFKFTSPSLSNVDNYLPKAPLSNLSPLASLYLAQADLKPALSFTL